MTTSLLNDYSHNHNITLLPSYLTRSVHKRTIGDWNGRSYFTTTNEVIKI